jgi:AraC-like DNA-binding protein/mannose-6-phosphate isomerase-like protein (cupin superfamily)
MTTVNKSERYADFQDVPSHVSAMAKSYPVGVSQEKHSHKRAQLIFAVSGVMEIGAGGRHWLIPPHRALWVPPEVVHEARPARMPFELRTIYVRVADVSAPLPLIPTLVYVTPLLRELIVRAVDLPIEEGVSGAAVQIVELIFNELHFLPAGEFDMPRVSDPRLVRIEEQLRRAPGDARGVEEWAALANMSSRTLGRKLKTETGISFAAWRQQIRLTEAVARLVRGESITSIASSLGYENIGSFSRMFKQAMGASPSELAIPHRGGAGVPSRFGMEAPAQS